MTRSDFVLATAIVLFAAFTLGWFANWLVHRLSRGTAAESDELDRLARELHEAETARDQAITYLQDREAELMGHLQQAEADLGEAIETLHAVRGENADLRARLDHSSRG